MKGVIPFVICIFWATWAQADILPKDQKSIYVQANITNVADYPEFVFIQLETLGQAIQRAKIIPMSGTINKTYKPNGLEILAVPRTYFNKSGGIQGLDLLNDPVLLRGGQSLECGPQWVPQTSPLAGKDGDYRLTLSLGGLSFQKTHEKTYEEGPNHPSFNLFFPAFFITLAMEALVFFILIQGGIARPRPTLLRASFALAAAQVISLPLLWVIITHFHLMGTGIILGGEALAVGAETLVYRIGARLHWKGAFISALTCNLASYGLGYLV